MLTSETAADMQISKTRFHAYVAKFSTALQAGGMAKSIADAKADELARLLTARADAGIRRAVEGRLDSGAIGWANIVTGNRPAAEAVLVNRSGAAFCGDNGNIIKMKGHFIYPPIGVPREEIGQFIEANEGVVNCLYLDTERRVTIGYGHLVAEEADVVALPLRKLSASAMIRRARTLASQRGVTNPMSLVTDSKGYRVPAFPVTDGDLGEEATADEKIGAYRIVAGTWWKNPKNPKKNDLHGESYGYRIDHQYQLFMTSGDMANLFVDDVAWRYLELKQGRMRELDTYPPQVQVFLIDCYYQQPPLFTTATETMMHIRNRRWGDAANAFRREWDNRKEFIDRNNNRVNQLERAETNRTDFCYRANLATIPLVGTTSFR